MQALFSSGRVVDLALALMLVEAVALLALRRSRGGGLAPAELLAFLLAGAGLLLALRAALVGAAWEWVALPLVLALLAHLADLGLRWRRGSSR
ncbi:hypothetical protein DOO78_18070 [Roseicella frigidaeris]|uniref:Uncharacterized protein n=1 Tax=Roseicella frigidaeris TaxID=2230885 RepID=A0A327M4M1_9PROT|nr:hypothetical protein DOO78_18070 [Roseicella frigidaeris]